MSNQGGYISGIDEVLKALDALPYRMSKKIIYKANFDILREIVRDPLKAALPYSARSKKGIAVQKAKGQDGGVYIGVNTNAYWLRFLEFGTQERVTKKGAEKGVISARPFIVGFIESRTASIIDAVRNRYDKYITDALTKELKRVDARISKF